MHPNKSGWVKEGASTSSVSAACLLACSSTPSGCRFSAQKRAPGTTCCPAACKLAGRRSTGCRGRSLLGGEPEARRCEISRQEKGGPRLDVVAPTLPVRNSRGCTTLSSLCLAHGFSGHSCCGIAHPRPLPVPSWRPPRMLLAPPYVLGKSFQTTRCQALRQSAGSGQELSEAERDRGSTGWWNARPANDIRKGHGRDGRPTSKPRNFTTSLPAWFLPSLHCGCRTIVLVITTERRHVCKVRRTALSVSSFLQLYCDCTKKRDNTTKKHQKKHTNKQHGRQHKQPVEFPSTRPRSALLFRRPT